MQSRFGYEQLLTQEEVDKTLSILESLSDEWTPRGSDVYYTLGAVSHMDAPQDSPITKDTISIFNEKNKIISNNFQYLYKIITNKVVELFGPCEIVDDVPAPGFYIFGSKKNNEVQKLSPYGDIKGQTTIHKDGLFDMLNYKWEKYGGATDSFGMTLCLEVPKHGTGILIWDQPNSSLYSNSPYAIRAKSFDFNKNENNANIIKKYIKNPIPEVIDYKPGYVFWQHGGIYHAVGYSIDTLNTDRRITMQVFGVKCDGIWRLIF